MFKIFGGIWNIIFAVALAAVVWYVTKDLKWAAVTLVAALAAIAAYTAFTDPRRIQKKKRQLDVDDLENKGVTLTYQRSQYMSWADSLEAAMFDAGTDDETLRFVFRKMKNDRDVIELNEAWDAKDRPYTGGVLPNILAAIGAGTHESLAAWLSYEWSTSEKKAINTIWSQTRQKTADGSESFMKSRL